MLALGHPYVRYRFQRVVVNDCYSQWLYANLGVPQEPLQRGTLCRLYKSMVLPNIKYCNIIYNNCTLRDSIAIEQVQRRAALVCTVDC